MTWELRYIGGGCDPTPERYEDWDELELSIEDGCNVEVDDYAASYLDDPEDDDGRRDAVKLMTARAMNMLQVTGRYRWPDSNIVVELWEVLS